jgi:hypothetical protein
VIYAYGVGDAGAAAPPRPCGLGGARLRELEIDADLTAVYSRHRTLRPHPSPPLVLAHGRIVEALTARGTVLPIRFGTVLDGEDDLLAALVARRAGLRRALDRARGRVELGLRLLRADPGARPGASPGARPSASTGREYLLARSEEQRRAGEAARAVHAPLAELAAASVVRPRPPAPASSIMAAAYLVDAARVPDFRARAREVAARHATVEAVVTGPWPPYSFTGDDPGDGAVGDPVGGGDA